MHLLTTWYLLITHYLIFPRWTWLCNHHSIPFSSLLLLLFILLFMKTAMALVCWQCHAVQATIDVNLSLLFCSLCVEGGEGGASTNSFQHYKVKYTEFHICTVYSRYRKRRVSRWRHWASSSSKQPNRSIRNVSSWQIHRTIRVAPRSSENLLCCIQLRWNSH